MAYLQDTIAPEQLDVIVVSLQQINQRKAKAYVFKNTTDHSSSASIQRVSESEAFDGVMAQNLHLLTDNLQGLTDFTLSFNKDIILRKSCFDSLILTVCRDATEEPDNI